MPLMLVMKVVLLLTSRSISTWWYELYFDEFLLFFVSYGPRSLGALWLLTHSCRSQENKEGLELLKTAIAKAGYTGKVSLNHS